MRFEACQRSSLTCTPVHAWLASRPSTKLFARIVIQVRSPEEKPRIAASSYLNSAPLIWSFTKGSRRDDVTYVDAVPARCADLLATGYADFALVPVIEYQRIVGTKLVPDVCVGSRQKVRSVLLVSKFNNLKKIRSVALDESSRTSAALTKIIFQEFFAIEPNWTTANPDIRTMLRESDAALMIGDPALTFPRSGLNVWDLASLWHDFTGTGFVFAMWMAKSIRRPEFYSLDFEGAKNEGVHALEEIITDYKTQLSLPAEELRDYLTNNVTFNLDEDLRSGMQLYFQLAARHALIDRARPLEFLEIQQS